jgi:hypothetical protein
MGAYAWGTEHTRGLSNVDRSPEGWHTQGVKRHVRKVLAVALIGVTTWMAYDNVLSDVTPIQAEAEHVACNVKKCQDSHGLTKMSRAPWGQTFEFTWREGRVNVGCHREYYVFGTRKCAVE